MKRTNRKEPPARDYIYPVLISISLVFVLVTTVLTPAVWALADLRDHSTLKKWKNEAQNSKYGRELLTLLNDSNRRIKHNSTDKNSLYKRGYLYGVIGCTESAIIDLNNAIEIDPYFSKAYTERGICYLDKKDYVNALKDLNKALTLNAWSGNARFARGRLLLEVNEPQLAEKDLRTCTRSTTRFSKTLPGELPANYYNAVSYYLGKAYEKLGRRFDAVREYKKFQQTANVYSPGWLHRYADKPSDASSRVKKLSYRF